MNFGTPTKALHAGVAARAGLQAALLAQHGARAAADWLTGPIGMAEVMQGDVHGEQALTAVDALVASGTHGIETVWGLAVKPCSCCGSCHAGVDEMLAIACEHDLSPRSVDAIERTSTRPCPR